MGNKTKRNFIRLLCLLFALLFALCLPACKDDPVVVPPPSGGGGENPSPDPGPTDPPDPQPMEMREFIARAFNATASNFTLRAHTEKTAEKEPPVTLKEYSLVYDSTANTAFDYTFTGGRTVYKDGLLFVSAGEDGFNASEEACPLPSLKPVEQRKLEALLELLGIGDGEKIAADQNGYFLNRNLDLTQKANGVLNIIKKDIDQKGIVTVKDLLNYLGGTEYTEQQTAQLIEDCGDATLRDIIADGTLLTETQLQLVYNTARGLLSGSYDLPDYKAFMAACGDVSLSALLGGGSAAALSERLQQETTFEILSRYKYTEATLADFFAAKEAETAFKALTYEFSMRADTACVITSFSFKLNAAMTDVPVFKASLLGDRMKIVNVNNSYALSGGFSAVGTSSVTAPQKYAVLGVKEITVDGPGSYPFFSGSENVRLDEEGKPELIAESGAIEDKAAWAEALQAVKNGLTVNYESKAVEVTEDAYGNLVKIVKLGMTKLTVNAFEGLSFNIIVRPPAAG